MGSRWVAVLACLGLVMAGCGDDKKDATDCDGGACAGTGAMGGDGDGSGGSGGDGDGTGATGGDGDGVIDAGMMDSGMNNGPSIPQDGSQNAFCQSDDDCEGGRGCYMQTNICSEPCTVGGDECAALGDAYGCYNAGPGQQAYCRVECTGTDDTESCPSPQKCLAVAGGGGGAFRCGIDEGDVGNNDTAQWKGCQTDGDCMGDMDCYFGYCTSPCERSGMDQTANDDACDDPGGDSPAAVCSFRIDGGGGGGPGQFPGICAIPCEDGDSCPGDLSCAPYGGGGGGGGLWYCQVPTN